MMILMIFSSLTDILYVNIFIFKHKLFVYIFILVMLNYTKGQVQHLAKHLVKKNLGKCMLYHKTPGKQMVQQAQKVFIEQQSYKKPQTFHMIPRMLEQGPAGKRRNKYWEDTIRYYDQRRVGFFVCQVLAKKKISIPLR